MFFLKDGFCHCDKKDKCDGVKEKISYRTVERNNPHKTKLAVASFGPGTITLFCMLKTFKFYSPGVYDDLDCGR